MVLPGPGNCRHNRRGVYRWILSRWAAPSRIGTKTFINLTQILWYCQGYPDTVVIDASWKAARAFGILVFIFSCIVVAALLYTSCFPARAGIKFGRLMPPLYLLMAIFQGLTLLFLDSTACKANPLLSGLGSFVWPETCAISTGAKCYISATVFWAAAAFSSFNEQMALEAELTETDSDLQTGLLYDPWMEFVWIALECEEIGPQPWVTSSPRSCEYEKMSFSLHRKFKSIPLNKVCRD